MSRIVVLRPFVLNYPTTIQNAQGDEVATVKEVKFAKGEHEVPDEIANHWYIKSLADGRIESPEAVAARLTLSAEEAERQLALNKQLLEDAQRTLARVQGQATPQDVGGVQLDGAKVDPKADGKKAAK